MHDRVLWSLFCLFNTKFSIGFWNCFDSVLDSTLCDKFVSDFTTGRWFSPGIPVSPRQTCALQASLTVMVINSTNKKNEQSPLILTELTKHKADHDIGDRKSRSWLWTGTKIWLG